jgi:hypothetical protein
MDVHTRFDLVVHITWFSACDDTSTLLDDGVHHLDEIENSVIWERLWTFVIEIDEKLEHVSLLLHHVQFLTETYCVYALYVKFVKLFKRNLKDSTIHEDVCPRTLVCEPFLHSVLEPVLFYVLAFTIFLDKPPRSIMSCVNSLVVILLRDFPVFIRSP